MNILGIVEYMESHNTSAALLCDGTLVAAVEEERFTGRKHAGGVPLNAIESCLQQVGLRMSDVHLIAFADLPFRTGRASIHAELDIETLQRLHKEGVARYRSLLHKRLLDRLSPIIPWPSLQPAPAYKAALTKLREHYARLPPFRFYDHHRCHAAAAFFNSPFDQATIVTVDARGGPYSTVIWDAQACNLRRVAAEPYTNSLGDFYQKCTGYLGFGEFGEGKTMGLAAYGDPHSFSAPMSMLLDTNGPRWYQLGADPSPSLLGFSPREDTPAVTAPYPDFAAGCQNALELALERVVRAALKLTNKRNLCLGGGVALNCSANGRLASMGITDSIFVFPGASDAGLSVGAAMLCAAEAGELHRQAAYHCYWGPQFSPPLLEKALSAAPYLTFRHCEDIAEATAHEIAQGAIVGWFQGPMEFGPRALGNRSILADPRSIAIRDRVNLIKGREHWRPLAPAIPLDKAALFLDPAQPSPFMLFAGKVKSQVRCVIPAVTHADGTARMQMVTREQNPLFYDLLQAAERELGIPVLLNTSFNLSGDPIVCTPENAVNSFLKSHLDVLVLGQFSAKRRSHLQ